MPIKAEKIGIKLRLGSDLRVEQEMSNVSINIPEAEKEYAIFKTGGKQYQAVVGQTLAVEKIEGEDGSSVNFDEVLFVKKGDDNYEFGRPFIKGAAVKAKILKQTKGPKLVIFKFRRRKKSRVKNGHRQPLTVVRFEAISSK